MNFRIKLATWLGRLGLRWLARKVFDVEKGEQEFVELTKLIVGRLADDKND